MSLTGWVMDWITLNVAPEWILVGSGVSSLAAMAALFWVLVRATRIQAPQRPAEASGVLRVPPYIPEAGFGRHRAAEWAGGRDMPWPGRLR